MRRQRFPAYPPSSRVPRRGWTLIELLAVTSLTLLIAGAATVLIAKLLRAGQHHASALVQQRTLHLWESQFRQDGRLAQSARINTAPDQPARLEFQQPGQVVTYQKRSDCIERHVNQELQGRWECGPGDWAFSLLEENRIVRAEYRQAAVPPLSSNGQPPQGTNPPQWLRIQADVALSAAPTPPPTIGEP